MNEVGRTPGSNRKTGEALPALKDNKALKCLGPPPLVEGEDADGTVRNSVCEAIMMEGKGASYGYRERPAGPTFSWA